MEEYASIIIRTLVLYAAILTIFRVMGKREIGELSLLDLVVFMMLAEMAAIGIENTDEPMIKSLVPMFLLVVVQFLLAFISLKSKRFRLLVDGTPSVIIREGKIDEHEMRKQRYNFDDLLLQLREYGISDIEDVSYAILETSGKLSVFKKSSKSKLALTVVLDGEVDKGNLSELGKDQEWLETELKKLGYDNLKDISYCNYSKDDEKFFVDLKDEIK
ncbi:DUF421 domain-containing protein [Mesobacillus maritimus]|uniref:DUF421 domain-containing protein n=1 Tax=Mesobacillus maritimus TaxID=1643336 RepID=UPI00203CF786|nr:DUF421 domain-containing protein [Mesobacillus maritimus]MCM3587698.1 DUF421 domain-containing protein [Mesobacillus maritimus]MCM3669943.1 DUF421 domain-containing protein [Mesobacillus maritimus]